MVVSQKGKVVFYVMRLLILMFPKEDFLEMIHVKEPPTKSQVNGDKGYDKSLIKFKVTIV